MVKATFSLFSCPKSFSQEHPSYCTANIYKLKHLNKNVFARALNKVKNVINIHGTPRL